jgi:apolipoprotein N-acyltransferase
MRNIIEKVLPFMTELNMLSDDLTPGHSAEIIDTGHGKAGRLICFDSIYASLARDSVKNGAEYILLSTNDSWYRDSASAYQHNSHAILRAVENRRYIARAASTGISSVISSEGRVTDMLFPLVDGYICTSVYTGTQRTLYSYVGDVIVVPCAAVIAFFVILDLIEKKKLRKMRGNAA